MAVIYKQATPQHVKFQRIIMGWLAIVSLFFREIDLIWIFFGITVLSSFVGTEYSLITLFYKLIRKIFKYDLVHISPHHLRYYQINVPMDIIEHILRFIASSTILALYYNSLEFASWTLLSFLSTFMMLSAYFGFCLSALVFVLLGNVCKKFHVRFKALYSADCNSHYGEKVEHINQNCILAKRCFAPYKRCDTCNLHISHCLGMKFNVLVLIIGTLMVLFFLLDNVVYIQINILTIMALIFWFGYQVNYGTDELAEINVENIELNKKLVAHMESLEDEVKRRTAEIEHLVTYDMLTELFNRFTFEKKLGDVLANLNDNSNSHMAFIDLDKFKHINDTAGHLAGDKLLKNVSMMFLSIVGDKGMVARVGGDEFAILFEDISKEEALKYCEEICEQAGSYVFEWEGENFGIGTSIGLATLESSMHDIKAIFHHADEACYAAKRGGRNQVCVHK